MRIPNQLKVGPFVYAVERPEIVNDRDRDRDGEFDHQQLTIRVEKGLKEPLAEEVFLHEVIHAVDLFMQTELTEAQVQSLSLGLYMVLKENRLLAD